VGKVPDFLPNKPTVVGSRGQNVGSGYLNRGSSGAGVGSPNLPQLSSGGIAINNNSIRKNSGGIRGPGNPGIGAPQGGIRPGNNLNMFSKYSSGLGGGIGGGSGIGGTGSPYNMAYNENR